MTNWMTAAGLAFMAGGLAALISLRAVIFGRADRTGTSTRLRRPAAVLVPPAMEIPAASEAPAVPERLRKAIPAACEPLPPTEFPLPPAAEFPLPPEPAFPLPPAAEFPLPPAMPDLVERSAYADYEPEVMPDLVERSAYEDYEPEEMPEPADPEYDDDLGYEDSGVDAVAAGHLADLRFADTINPPGYGRFVPMQAVAPTAYPPVRPEVDRSDIRYGDRVDDWVRPHYQDLDDRPPAGDYWTPVPEDLYADPEPSARGYGWPVPVERLPSVPSYEPSTGFDLTPVEAAEPTAFVTPSWRPSVEDRRVRQPRSWRERDDNRAWRERDESRFRRDRDESRSRRERDESRSRRERDDYRYWREREERLSDVPRSAVRRRPRPRPRPSAQAAGPNYISRHSAGPYG